MQEATKSAELAGITAGKAAISTAGKEGLDLTFRRYSIHDLAEHANYEEVMHLLIFDKLPTKKELANFQKKLICPLAEYIGPMPKIWPRMETRV